MGLFLFFYLSDCMCQPEGRKSGAQARKPWENGRKKNCSPVGGDTHRKYIANHKCRVKKTSPRPAAAAPIKNLVPRLWRSPLFSTLTQGLRHWATLFRPVGLVYR